MTTDITKAHTEIEGVLLKYHCIMIVNRDGSFSIKEKDFALGADLIEGMKEIITHEKERLSLEKKNIKELENQCQMCGSQRCSGVYPEAVGCVLHNVLIRKRGAND